VNDQSDLKRIFEQKLRERREFIERYTAFHEQREFEAQVDYRRKRGLLEEINRTAREADDEQLVIEKIKAAQATEEQGPVERPAGFQPTRRVSPTPATSPAGATPPPGVSPGGWVPPSTPPRPNPPKPE